MDNPWRRVAATGDERLRRYLHDPVGAAAVAVSVEVLWNALEHSHVAVDAAGPPASSRTALLARRRETNAMYQLSDPETLAVFRQLLSQLFLNGRRAADKQLRNEVLIVASLVASHRRSHKAFRTQRLLQLLLTYATASELPEDEIDALKAATSGADPNDPEGGPLADRHAFATSAPEDLEMKRILWALLSDLGRGDRENLDLVVEADFMGALLMYLDVEALDASAQEYEEPDDWDEDELDEPPEPELEEQSSLARAHRRIPTTLKRLPLTQLHVLQQQAMAVLLNLAPRAPAAFQALQGHILALRFLDACDVEDDRGGQTQQSPDDGTQQSGSVKTAGTAGSARSASGLVQGALMLLISVVGLPGLQHELGALDAVRIMLRRFTDKRAGTALRADAVQILAKLCDGHEENQTALRRLDGIAALVDELELYCGGRAPAPRLRKAGGDDDAGAAVLSSSAAEKVSPLVVGVLDCLWNAVVGNRRSEARLPPTHGVDALLALLEVGPRLMRLQVCGVLADLARNAKLRPYVRAWRSDRTMRTAAQLFAHVWEDEEIRLGCDRERGVLSNVAQPLRRQRGGARRSRDEGTRPPAAGDDDDSSDDEGGATARAPPPPPAAATTKFVQRAQGGGLQASAAAKAERALRQAVGSCDLRAKVAKPARGSGSRGALKNSSPRNIHAAAAAVPRLLVSADGSTQTRSVPAAQVAPIVALLGPEALVDGVPADDRATLAMVKNYEQFVDGEAWADVRDQLRAAGVKPIAADARLLELKIGASTDAAERTRAEQEILAGERAEEERRAESAYLGTILLQRDQEIRQLAIKRNALVPKSLQQKRRAEQAERDKAAAEAAEAEAAAAAAPP